MGTAFTTTEDILDELVGTGLLPGVSVLLRYEGELAWEAVRGLARLDPPERASERNIWAAASISKPVAATGIMQLVDLGLCSLDSPVVDYLPEFGPGKEKVLVRYLLSHTSGLAEDWPDDADIESLGMVAALGRLDLHYEPGTRCSYSTCAFELVGAIIRTLSGQSWPDYSLEHIFTPLGMSESRFAPPDEWEPRFPLVYDPDGGLDVWANDPLIRSQGMPGGGLYTTARDLGHLGQAFLDRDARLLTEDSYEQMATLQTPGLRNLEGLSQTWGLGWYLNMENRPVSVQGVLSERTLMHSGATGCWLAIDPDRQLVIARLANRAGIDLTETGELDRRLAIAVLTDLGLG